MIRQHCHDYVTIETNVVFCGTVSGCKGNFPSYLPNYCPLSTTIVAMWASRNRWKRMERYMLWEGVRLFRSVIITINTTNTRSERPLWTCNCELHVMPVPPNVRNQWQWYITKCKELQVLTAKPTAPARPQELHHIDITDNDGRMAKSTSKESQYGEWCWIVGEE